MPMMPDAADLHINAPLTNVSVRYYQSSDVFLSGKVFPTIPVNKRSDVYWKYAKSDWRRTDARKRAPGTESAGTSWKAFTDQYLIDVYAVHDDIDDQTRANADSNFDLEADSTELVTNQLMLLRDQDWANAYFQPNVWATEYEGVGTNPGDDQFLQWDLAPSDPLYNNTEWATDFRLLTGFDFNFLVLGADCWKALKNHPALLDRIKYTQKGVVTRDLVASFFDLPVNRLFVSYASQNLGPHLDDPIAQDEAAEYDWILNSKSALFGYAPDAPGLKKPSAGYTFTWRTYGAGNRDGLTMSRMRMQHLRSDRVEGEVTYVHKQVSPDCGVFLKNVVS